MNRKLLTAAGASLLAAALAGCAALAADLAADLAQAEAALRHARLGLEKATLKAPCAGTVGEDRTAMRAGLGVRVTIAE